MKFFARSAFVLLALYGMVFAIGDAYLVHENAPMWVAVAFVGVFIVAQFALSPAIIEWVFSIDWDESAMPAGHRQFVERLCAEHGLPPIRLGLIHSGTPNAFSFGRFRRDARVVVTQGLLDVLTENEANAVLAHEVGHIEHYDFAVMTLAAAAPLVLYQMYVWGNRVKNLRAVAWCAYLAYIVGQFLVLTLNRTREYWADHFSAECTHAPGDLASALVKIAYGMVKVDGEYRESLKTGSTADRKTLAQQHQLGGAIALMGISNLNSGASLALGMANPQQAAAVMRWDLVNPWARVYEMSSTHPLTALRVRALNDTAGEMHVPVAYPLPDGDNRKMRWGAFPVEFFFWIAPFVCTAALLFEGFFRHAIALAGVRLPSELTPWLLIAVGATWAMRIAFRYRGNFEPRRVGELLEDVGVSQMTPRAVELRAEIIGNGIPGFFWSPDLVMQDESGQMFVLYRSSVPFGRLLFAMTDAYRFIGEQVVVRGWYRRGLRPYVELSNIRATVTKAAPIRGSGPVSLFSQSTLDAAAASKPEELHQRSYSRWIQLGVAAVVATVGVIWLLS